MLVADTSLLLSKSWKSLLHNSYVVPTVSDERSYAEY